LDSIVKIRRHLNILDDLTGRYRPRLEPPARLLFTFRQRSQGGTEMIERRCKIRFPVVEIALWCKSKSITGVGQTINLSSSGTLLRVADDFCIGDRVDVSVDLPILTENSKVQLKAVGRVVRLEEGCVAIQFVKQDLSRTSSRIEAVDVSSAVADTSEGNPF
jgi:hypothetical protein